MTMTGSSGSVQQNGREAELHLHTNPVIVLPPLTVRTFLNLRIPPDTPLTLHTRAEGSNVEHDTQSPVILLRRQQTHRPNGALNHCMAITQ